MFTQLNKQAKAATKTQLKLRQMFPKYAKTTTNARENTRQMFQKSTKTLARVTRSLRNSRWKSPGLPTRVSAPSCLRALNRSAQAGRRANVPQKIALKLVIEGKLFIICVIDSAKNVKLLLICRIAFKLICQKYRSTIASKHLTRTFGSIAQRSI